VHPVVLDAYAALSRRRPTQRWVYGETGWVFGGRFKPHRTHQNGLSVDFFVPVFDSKGAPTTVPSSFVNRFGYDVDFDAAGKNDAYAIDFESMAEHLLELRTAAKQHGVRIVRVIFAQDLQPELRQTRAWPMIRDLPFSKRPAWVRHDDHYHVDFDVQCLPLSSAR
jgi:penicillin-insensitive murein endopeptidase